MTNSLKGLNDHLFSQMARLADPDMPPEKLDAEVKRAAAMVSVADQISSNADLQLKAAKLFAEHGKNVLPMLPQIGSESS